eukprot:GFYU01008751.1.p1 GENE.GFYU01008751.1~~GFYU01008751.1.p1  ORF type:complete len:487 (-),score=54.90 GFYU01008751.1:244-1704(-)
MPRSYLRAVAVATVLLAAVVSQGQALHLTNSHLRASADSEHTCVPRVIPDVPVREALPDDVVCASDGFLGMFSCSTERVKEHWRKLPPIVDPDNMFLPSSYHQRLKISGEQSRFREIETGNDRITVYRSKEEINGHIIINIYNRGSSDLNDFGLCGQLLGSSVTDLVASSGIDSGSMFGWMGTGSKLASCLNAIRGTPQAVVDIVEQIRKYDRDGHNVLLSGFSMGGGLSVYASLLYFYQTGGLRKIPVTSISGIGTVQEFLSLEPFRGLPSNIDWIRTYVDEGDLVASLGLQAGVVCVYPYSNFERELRSRSNPQKWWHNFGLQHTKWETALSVMITPQWMHSSPAMGQHPFVTIVPHQLEYGRDCYPEIYTQSARPGAGPILTQLRRRIHFQECDTPVQWHNPHRRRDPAPAHAPRRRHPPPEFTVPPALREVARNTRPHAAEPRPSEFAPSYLRPEANREAVQPQRGHEVAHGRARTGRSRIG